MNLEFLKGTFEERLETFDSIDEGDKEGHGWELIGGLDSSGDGGVGGEREGDDVEEVGRDGGGERI